MSARANPDVKERAGASGGTIVPCSGVVGHTEATASDLDRWFATMRTRLADRVLPIDEPIADAWALLSVPNPLPLIDGLLAATAQVRGLTLVTRNTADVGRTGISILDPFAL